MKIIHSILLNITLVTILVASFFFVNTAANTSKYETTSLPEYDPWVDLDDDGDVDLYDAVRLLKIYGTKGSPITKASITYDSGWVDITDKCGQYFNVTHNLNSTDIIVDITGKTTVDGGAHQRNLGLTGYMPGWSRTYGGTNYDYVFSLVQTVDGGYALAGYTDSFGAGADDFWLIKVDAFGNTQWNKTYGGEDWDVAKSVVQTSEGGYAIAGRCYFFGYDFWLVKTESAGNIERNKTYGGANND